MLAQTLTSYALGSSAWKDETPAVARAYVYASTACNCHALSLSLYASITCAALFRWIRVYLPSNRWIDGGLERMPGIIGFV
jgi:hypothetical protein